MGMLDLSRITKILGILVISSAFFGLASAQADSPGGLLQQKKPNVNYEEFIDFTVPANPVPVGNIVADVTLVALSQSNSACDPSHFAGFSAGNIALVKRGTCSFATKVLNAMDAGAAGVIIANNTGGLGTISLAGADIDIPVLFITWSLGNTFANEALYYGGLRVHILVRNPSED